MSPKDYWDVSVRPEDRQQLDEDLIRELNEDEDRAEESPLPPGGRRTAIKAGSLVLALVLAALVLGRLLNVFTLPSLEFLYDSRRLSRDPRVRELQQAVVSIEADGRRGTGFNIHPDGIIVTNYHVIAGSSSITVRFPGALPHLGEVLVGIPQVDLALLSVEGGNLPALELAVEGLKREDTVLMIGNPLGLSSVVSEGTVEGFVMLRDWEEPVLMIKGPVYRGSSGSPVFNREGLVVAVIFATLQQQGPAGQEDIIGLAVPAAELMALLEGIH